MRLPNKMGAFPTEDLARLPPGKRPAARGSLIFPGRRGTPAQAPFSLSTPSLTPGDIPSCNPTSKSGIHAREGENERNARHGDGQGRHL